MSAHIKTWQERRATKKDAQQPAANATRQAAEARQRATLEVRLGDRKPSPATADFDLPAPNDLSSWSAEAKHG